jgi:hypothetical protein
MAKELVSDSNNILRNILIILIVAGIAFIAYYLYSTGSSTKNVNNVLANNPPVHPKEENSIEYRTGLQGGLQGMNNPIMNKENFNPNGPVVGDNNMEHFSNNGRVSEERRDTSFPKDQLTAEELLPQDNSSLWAQVNPSGEGNLKDRNFLQSGYHIGINTVGQTLRNANLQLRSEPPCPQVRVSPWLQSTIDPDMSRKPMEIGGCA